jgi:hypothetical protein
MIDSKKIKMAFEGINKTLTDFKGCEDVFLDIFEKSHSCGRPIKNVLEIGVYQMRNSDLPGQSMKTLMILSDLYGVKKYISIDIDECSSTADRCKKYVSNLGISVQNHKFVQSNSMDFDILSEFPNGVDFIFLDSSHDGDYPESKLGYENSGGGGMTYREICFYSKHLSEYGHLVLHDTKNYYVPKEYGFNVEGAVQKFIDENKDFKFIEYDPNENGLGEIVRVDV